MSEATEVPMPMVCVDSGGTLTDDDAIWSPGIGVFWHINYSQCITSLNERLTAATQRAEAAEAMTQHREAERAVIGTVKQFLAICNNETVSDSNAAAWAIGEMEAAYATLRELEGTA